MILPAQLIRARVGMITPFVERGTFNGLSFGLSSAGYDIRIAMFPVASSYRGSPLSKNERRRIGVALDARLDAAEAAVRSDEPATGAKGTWP